MKHDRQRVTYSKEQREYAKATDRPLFTVDLDARHCKELEGRETARVTLQGPARPETERDVRRMLLKLAHVPSTEIERLIAEMVFPEPASPPTT